MRLPTLEQIREAQAVVYRHMAPTPQYTWPLVNGRLGAEAWIKHENHTPVGAFKLRGALVYMDWLRRATRTWQAWWRPPAAIMGRAWPWPRGSRGCGR